MTVTDKPRHYRGRFAPSPSGPLHLGSLVAAMGSYLQSRRLGGEWLLRIEDLDPPREVAGAGDAIISSLESHGFQWDGPITWQSQRGELYSDALSQLQKNHLVFACSCSRRDLEDHSIAGQDKSIYPGTCRDAGYADDTAMSLRFRTPSGRVCFDDGVQGRICEDVDRECGDFVVRRRDGLYAYQLAVVVDDSAQEITEVVRGCDLLDSTPRQIRLQQALSFAQPYYAHLPLVLAPDSKKLSKQTGARPLNDTRPLANLIAAHKLLGQLAVPEADIATVRDFWAWAVPNWDLTLLKGQKKIAAPSGNIA